jgi:hypothetical protein
VNDGIGILVPMPVSKLFKPVVSSKGRTDLALSWIDCPFSVERILILISALDCGRITYRRQYGPRYRLGEVTLEPMIALDLFFFRSE